MKISQFWINPSSYHWHRSKRSRHRACCVEPSDFSRNCIATKVRWLYTMDCPLQFVWQACFMIPTNVPAPVAQDRKLGYIS